MADLSFIKILLTQSALQQRGYYFGPVDGNLSIAARHALMSFQNDNGFAVTGELDEELFCRLLELRRERSISTNDH